MWPDRPLNYIKLADDAEGIHFGIFIEGSLASIVSLFISGEQAQFRKLATGLGQQGKGLASLLVKYILEYAEQRGVKRVWCNARSDKTEFYSKFGLKITDQTFQKGGIDYVIMEYISVY